MKCINSSIFVVLMLFSLGMQAAMLPFIEEAVSDASESPLNATLNVILPADDELNTFIVKLKNLTTNEVISIGKGQYKVQQGAYELIAYIANLDEEIDPSFTQYNTRFEVEAYKTLEVSVPKLTRRRYTSWYDYFTVSLQVGSLNGDYEVTSILNEYYTALNIPNSYPAVNTLSENDSNSQSRIGLTLNYKHFFADSKWMAYGEWFTDSDSNQSLDRSGFSLGAGRYWSSDKSNYWVASGIGSETAQWNNPSIGGSSTISISGKNDTQSLNLEAGLIYQPINTSLSVKFDLINQSLMFNVGYVFGGKKQGYIDPAFVN